MTITEQIGEIIKEICDNYCKCGEKIDYAVSDEQLIELTKPCDDCPLNRI